MPAISFGINMASQPVSKTALVWISISFAVIVAQTICKYVWDSISFSIILLMLLSTLSGLFGTGISSECSNV